MNPIVDGLKKKYGRQVKFVYYEMSEPSGKKRAREEGVMGTPTFLLLDRNGERVYMLQGSQPREVMEQVLEQLLARE